ncbi:DUF2860 family protein [Haliea sp. E17]|uniref:DUF2860 family protein n=1 Tax=Haliea sp. E17 TaxID=3401576 RepID=UPI003AB02186
MFVKRKAEFLKAAVPMLTGLCLTTFGSPVNAVTIIPEKSGLSGYVNVGAGVLDIESNMIAKLARGIVDVGDAVTDDISGEPDNESAVVPMLNFELSYTFASTRTQIYAGNLLEDFLTFDLSALAGVRQDAGGAGIFGLALVSTSLAADVWEDPYQTDVKRRDTERTGEGYRLTWERMFGSGFEMEYSSKSIDIDNERSGQGLGLSTGQRKLLDRNGDLNQFKVSYEAKLGEGRHILTPSLEFREADLDGGAMASDGYGASLNYIYLHNPRWRWVFNVAYQDMEYDRSNPVYGERDDAQRFGASATVFYSAPFGWEPWALNLTAGYFTEDHDIEFYDASVTAFTVGLFRRF